MITSELISVIVPVYNVSKYLDQCVGSIVAQSYKDLEIILVDDGATDDSGAICDKWAERDSRISVIHQKNQGLSGARNTGLRVARGNWVVFCDSDDWMEGSVLEKALENSLENKSDLVVWGYFADFLDENDKLLSSREHNIPSFLSNEFKPEHLLDEYIRRLWGYAWNKLYRRVFIQDANFSEGIHLVEDALFNCGVLQKKPKVSFLAFCGTHYNQRKRNTLGNTFNPNYFEWLSLANDYWVRTFVSYNLKEEDILMYKNRESFNSVFLTIRAISNNKAFSFKDKYRAIEELLKRKDANAIITQFKPYNFRKRFIKTLLVHEFIFLLILIVK